MYEQIKSKIRSTVQTDERGCWNWQKRIDKEGYGQLRLKGAPSRTSMAHRVSYEVFVGPIPAGLQIDHLCRNRACVNPEHLEPVTPRENTRRSPIVMAGVRALQKTCKRGHEFTEANTRRNAQGHRWCRECNRQLCRAYKIRRAEGRTQQAK